MNYLSFYDEPHEWIKHGYFSQRECEWYIGNTKKFSLKYHGEKYCYIFDFYSMPEYSLKSKGKSSIISKNEDKKLVYVKNKMNYIGTKLYSIMEEFEKIANKRAVQLDPEVNMFMLLTDEKINNYDIYTENITTSDNNGDEIGGNILCCRLHESEEETKEELIRDYNNISKTKKEILKLANKFLDKMPYLDRFISRVERINDIDEIIELFSVYIN